MKNVSFEAVTHGRHARPKRQRQPYKGLAEYMTEMGALDPKTAQHVEQAVARILIHAFTANQPLEVKLGRKAILRIDNREKLGVIRPFATFDSGMRQQEASE